MKKEKLKKILERVKKIDNLIFDIQKELRDEIFFEDFKKEIKEIFDESKNKELSVRDVAIKLWVSRGGVELKNKDDYYIQPEYNNLEMMVRDVIFYLEEEDGYLDIVRKKKMEEVESIFHKKSKKIKKTIKK